MICAAPGHGAGAAACAAAGIASARAHAAASSSPVLGPAIDFISCVGNARLPKAFRAPTAPSFQLRSASDRGFSPSEEFC